MLNTVSFHTGIEGAHDVLHLYKSGVGFYVPLQTKRDPMFASQVQMLVVWKSCSDQK